MIRIFLQNRIWLIGFRVTSSFVQVVISQNELKLLGSVGTWITLIRYSILKSSSFMFNQNLIETSYAHDVIYISW